MCLATPVKLEKIDKDFGFVKNGKTKVKVSLSLIKDPKVGDWLLVHGNMAINKLTAHQAEEILKLVRCSCEG